MMPKQKPGNPADAMVPMSVRSDDSDDQDEGSGVLALLVAVLTVLFWFVAARTKTPF